MNIQPRYTLKLNPPLRWPFVYSSGTASSVLAERSFSKMPRKMTAAMIPAAWSVTTASEVKSVLKVVRDQDS